MLRNTHQTEERTTLSKLQNAEIAVFKSRHIAARVLNINIAKCTTMHWYKFLD